ncbi:hypothetical protein GJ496_003924 [Pomphorhynchus laevis]|nr:hypothetical protein GJ496_003924 [Pomphorhynchus laevis]
MSTLVTRLRLVINLSSIGISKVASSVNLVDKSFHDIRFRTMNIRCSVKGCDVITVIKVPKESEQYKEKIFTCGFCAELSFREIQRELVNKINKVDLGVKCKKCISIGKDVNNTQNNSSNKQPKLIHDEITNKSH